MLMKNVLMMKKYILAILALSALLLTSCGKDNYDEPKSLLTGKIVSATSKEAVGVKNQTDGGVKIQLWQDGYELYTAIEVSVNQDGTFSASVFDGTYKVVTTDNNGPWVNDRDTIVVQVKGNAFVEYPVKPYFEMSNEEFKLEGNTLTATFDLQQPNAIQDRELSEVTLYVSNTMFVDDSFNKMKVNAESPAVGSNSITMDITDLASNAVLYARIGVKINGVEQRLYTAGTIRIK